MTCTNFFFRIINPIHSKNTYTHWNRQFNGRKTCHEFLKLVKNGQIFDHIFQILKFFKNLFVASKGHIDDTKLLLKWFLSWGKYIVTRNFFRFSPCFWALNFENSYLWNVVRMGQLFLGNQLLVYISSKCAMNEKILLTWGYELLFGQCHCYC